MDDLNELKQAAIKVLQDYYDFLGQDPERRKITDFAVA